AHRRRPARSPDGTSTATTLPALSARVRLLGRLFRFFFQAEDGIRDFHVTGVQTCALPISNPFLKYCLNNALIPAIFLIVYFINALNFGLNKELIPLSNFLLNAGGFAGGFVLVLLISFAYFFTADRRILRFYHPRFLNNVTGRGRRAKKTLPEDAHGLKVGFYLNSYFKVKKARPVGHYNQTFLDEIFKRHHFS